MTGKKRWVLGIFIAFIFLPFISSPGQSAEYPTRDINVILGFAPGGTLDISVRIIADELSKNLSTPIVVINKAGGGGALAAEFVREAKPDGYTVMAAPIGVFNILPLINPGLKYKLADFIPLCKFVTSPNVIVARKASPFHSLEDVIAAARKSPGKLAASAAGMGTAGHLNVELLNAEAGIDVIFIPAKSGAEVNTQVLGGHVDFSPNGLPAVMPLLKSGDLRGLAITSLKRFPELPDIPTIGEKGFPRSALGVWVGLFVPKGTPKNVGEKLTAAVRKALDNPTVVKNYAKAGIMADYAEGKEFIKFMDEERNSIRDIVIKAKIGK